jgi:superfamily I DNA/RNA helicase
MEPTEEQKLIIDHEGNAVVIAAPGSGKTYVLSQKIKNNLKTLIEHQGVIAISYTNKASTELKNRSLSNGENPKSSFFGTIDKFYLSEIIIPFAKHLFGIPKAEIFVAKSSTLSDDKRQDFDFFNLQMKLEEVTDGGVAILGKYFLEGVIAIETIGVFANFVFTNSIACQNYIKARYRKIYIDEYQDSGYEQHQLFLKIAALGITSVAVGDLNQSIFGFSGKDARYLSELAESESFKCFRLNRNHRCHPSIINYSDYLLNPKTELIPVEKTKVICRRLVGSETDIASWIDSSIESIRKFFEVEHINQIAVLTKVNRTGELLNANLKTPNKFLRSNELDVNMTVWSAIFSSLLSFVFNPNFKFLDVVEVFASYNKFKSKDLKRLKVCRNNIEEISVTSPIDTDGLKTEFLRVVEIIAPRHQNFESIKLLDEVLADKIKLNSYREASKAELSILNIHKSKGLEFDVVIHLDLHNWILPNKKPEDWTQDLNLHYVALTRAKKGCVLVKSSQRTTWRNIIDDAVDSDFLSLNDIHKLRIDRGS